MKKYRDIENIRFEDFQLSEDVVRKKNTDAFEVNDEVVVQEKVDGSCASFRYLGSGEFVACSRRKVLDEENNLNGFYQYCKSLAEQICKNESDIKMQASFLSMCTFGTIDNKIDLTDLIFFGEWTGQRNVIVYDDKWKEKWYLFDIYCPKVEHYCHYEGVYNFAKLLGLDMVQTLSIFEKFKTWDSILCLANPKFSMYGDTQEGIVIKNMSKLFDNELRLPVYLKLVNTKFRETKKVKRVKPSVDEEYELAMKHMSTIVTKNRVQKCLTKLCEDGILPKDLVPQNMSDIAKVLPKNVFEDCQKEESEVVKVSGKLAGKVCNRLVMNFARELIVG